MIDFNRPFLSGEETHYIVDALKSSQISGNGKYTQKCQKLLEREFGFKNTLLTSSCTSALEMAAILCDIKEGDEVIMPSYTYVSTANAFVLRGAKIVFCDSETLKPSIDASKIESLISERTRVIVPVHYGGIACDMDIIMGLAEKYNLLVVEDAAQAIDAYYKGKPLGSIGHFGTFSFHETKNVISGKGGALVINDSRFIDRAEVIWEEGTNRSLFWKGAVDKYEWVDIGSSFLMSELEAAFLFAQLESIKTIQTRRRHIWQAYWDGLKSLGNRLRLPCIPSYGSNNAHMFYIVCSGIEERTAFIEFLKEDGINAVFHYSGLHKSPFYLSHNPATELPNCEFYENGLVRLPFYFELRDDEQQRIIERVLKFFSPRLPD